MVLVSEVGIDIDIEVAQLRVRLCDRSFTDRQANQREQNQEKKEWE